VIKYAVVDFRMRKIEKEYIKSLGYEIIENGFNLNTYDEISAHTDIYYLKVGDMVFSSPEKKGALPFNTVSCTTHIGSKYPEDVPYNVCIVGKKQRIEMEKIISKYEGSFGFCSPVKSTYGSFRR